MADVKFFNYHQLGSDQYKKIKRARWLARTNLKFLCNDVLHYKDVCTDVHGPLLNHLQKFPKPNAEQYYENDDLSKGFVQYKPVIPLEEFVEQEKIKRRLILDFRSSLKTTCNVMAHTIQWILNYPNIGIIIIQSSIEKAEEILSEIKGHFQFNNTFRDLFPEHVPQKKIGDWCTKGAMRSEANDVNNLSLGMPHKEGTIITGGIDKGMAGKHLDVLKFSDIVDPTNTKTDASCLETIKQFNLCQSLLTSPKYWIDVEGTRYSFCLEGNTKITTGDWQQKNIKDITVGQTVVGWDWFNGSRFLKEVKVIAKGSLLAQANEYTFASGRKVICTPEHKWWRGKQWKKNDKNREYSEIKYLKSVRRLMLPEERDETWAAGWLAGFYDGEGSFGGNPGHPSGMITIIQSMHNPDLIQKTREALTLLGFNYSENWHSPSQNGGKENWHDRCVFHILGGWRARYKFIAKIAPFRNKKIKESLYGQLKTEEDRIVSVKPVGETEVFWITTESGNYIADGCCSKNSDLYGHIIEKDHELSEDRRIWSVYSRGCYKKKTLDGNPEKFIPSELFLPDLTDKLLVTPQNPLGKMSWWPKRFPPEDLEYMRITSPYTFATQYYNNPQSAEDGMIPFPPDKITWMERKIFDEKIPKSYYELSIDTAETDNQKSNYTSIAVGCWTGYGNLVIVDVIHGKFLPDMLIDKIYEAFLKYKPRNIKIEETSFVKGLMTGIRRKGDLHGMYLPIELIKRDNQVAKKERILNTLQPYFNKKYLIFLDDITCKDQILKELRQFPTGSQDDILDSIADFFQNKEFFGREQARKEDSEIERVARAQRLNSEYQKALPELINAHLGISTLDSPSIYRHDSYDRTGGL